MTSPGHSSRVDMHSAGDSPEFLFTGVLAGVGGVGGKIKGRVTARSGYGYGPGSLLYIYIT